MLCRARMAIIECCYVADLHLCCFREAAVCGGALAAGQCAPAWLVSPRFWNSTPEPRSHRVNPALAGSLRPTRRSMTRWMAPGRHRGVPRSSASRGRGRRSCAAAGSAPCRPRAAAGRRWRAHPHAGLLRQMVGQARRPVHSENGRPSARGCCRARARSRSQYAGVALGGAPERGASDRPSMPSAG